MKYVVVQQSRNIYRPVDGRRSDGTRYSISPFVSKFSNASPTTAAIVEELHTYLVDDTAASAASS